MGRWDPPTWNNTPEPLKNAVRVASPAVAIAEGVDRGTGNFGERDRQRRRDKEAEAKKAQDSAYETNKKAMEALKPADEAWLNKAKGLSDEADQAAKNSASTYSNTLQPAYKNNMEDAQKNASSAMTLQEAMDPNNRVQTAVRGMYENQAQNENRALLGSTGVLQSLGAQNFASQLAGAGPMTGGQLQALMAGNQQQSGAAFARGQGRIQNLRDQGLNRGFEQSNWAYGRGQEAKDRALQGTKEYEAAGTREMGRQSDLRGERGGWGQSIQAQTQAPIYREQALENARINNNMANITAELNKINADAYQHGKILQGGLGAMGALGGAYMGGAQGAQVGQQVGSGIGEGAVPPPQQANYSNPYGNDPYAQRQGFGQRNPYGR